MKTLLEVRDLTVCRGSATILDGVCWKIDNGEQWVLLGANGCGKTSLLSAITGYLMPTRGEITLFGETYGMTDWRELRKRVGLVSSSLRQMIPDTDTASEIIASGPDAVIGVWKSPGKARLQRAEQLLEQGGIGPLARRPWAVLSQGERQRVLVLRALIADPALLILDEPCAGLDPVARERFLATVQMLGASDPAIPLVLVTHHIEEITPCFTHAIVLKSGRVSCSGPVRETVTSRQLSDAFGATLSVRHRNGRWTLECRGTNLNG
jgi:iron complex transport system ATP-binding protein